MAGVHFQHQLEPNQQPEEKDPSARWLSQYHYMQKGIRFNTFILRNEDNKRKKKSCGKRVPSYMFLKRKIHSVLPASADLLP